MTDADAATMFWVLLDSALVGVAVLVLRAGYRWVQDREILSRRFALEGDEGDAMTHLVAVDLVRQNRNRIPGDTAQFLCSTGFDYPALFHKILSYIPRQWLERGEWLISPGFEGVHAALVYLAAWFIFTGSGAGEAASGLALIAAAGWALTPLLTRNPRRGSVIGERCFGYIFGHAFLFCLAMLSAGGNPLWIIPAALAFTIGAASSKFALQAMTFVALAFAAIRFDPLPVAALAVSAVTAIVLSGGYVVRVVSGTINHSRFYRSFLVRIHDYTRSFSTKDLAAGVRLLLRGRWREASASFRRHPIHRLPALVPWLFTFVLFTVAADSASPLTSALIAWVLAALLVTALTATDSLKFLGEAERYMEFALLPLVTLSIMIPPPVGPTAVFAVMAYSLYQLGRVYATPLRVSSATPESIELARWFAGRPAATIMTVPGRLSYPLVYGTAHRAVWWFINAPRGARLEVWKSLFEGSATYPYVAPAAFDRANAAFGAEMIAIDKPGAEAAAQYWGLRYDLKRYPVLFENARYVVLDAAVAARAAA
jgi:hypothetical protein